MTSGANALDSGTLYTFTFVANAAVALVSGREARASRGEQGSR
jgi:hypothetical protein